MKTIYGVLAVTVAVAAGCGDNDDGAQDNGQEAEVSDDEQAAFDAADGLADLEPEGPADQPVEHPDGLVVSLADLEEFPADIGADVPDGHVVVRVTLELENTGDEPADIDSPMQKMALMYGPNRQDADRAVGYMDDGHDWDDDGPRQVAPGESVEVFYSYQVPEDDLDDLAVEATIPNYSPYVFTGAETLL